MKPPASIFRSAHPAASTAAGARHHLSAAGLTCLLAALLSSPVAAQNPNPPAPAAAAKAPATQQPPVAAKQATASTPSRYIGETDLDAYLKSLSAVMSIRSRNTDPFGQLQDPDAKPITKPSNPKPGRRPAPTQVFPFQDIVNMIKVNTVMPKEKKFLVGTRSFRQGDRMSLTFRMKNIAVEILAVSSRRIDFRNLESGETASLKMDLLPVGMVPGTSGITAPGMVREQANSPIDLDSAITPEEPYTNR